MIFGAAAALDLRAGRASRAWCLPLTVSAACPGWPGGWGRVAAGAVVARWPTWAGSGGGCGRAAGGFEQADPVLFAGQPSGRCKVRWPRPWRAVRAATHRAGSSAYAHVSD